MTKKFILDQEDATVAGGNRRGIGSVDLQTSRTAADQVAGTHYSAIIGGENNTVAYRSTGADSDAGGSTIIGGQNNCITLNRSFIAGGCNNFIYRQFESDTLEGAIIAARDSIVTRNGYVFGGSTNTACRGGIVLGGNNNVATDCGVAIGTTATSGGSGIAAGSNVTSSSRNLVLGTSASATGTDNLVVGRNVSSSASCSMAVGGFNSVTGDYSVSIGGGFGGGNQVQGISASILGGSGNITYGNGDCSVIGGGYYNSLHTPSSFIGGGYKNCLRNTTCDEYAFGSVIAGGAGNNTIGGTWDDTTNTFTTNPTPQNTGKFSFIGGGKQNVAGNDHSIVVGGCENIARSCSSFIGGGSGNQIGCSTCPQCTCFASIVGGKNNCVFGNTWLGAGDNVGGFIGGGENNCIYQSWGSVIGGCCNVIAYMSSIPKGSSILGGTNNRVTSPIGTILGGNLNVNGGCYSTILNGCSNTINAGQTSIVGGICNTITAGGCGNGIFTALCSSINDNSESSAILAGWANTLEGRVQYSAIVSGTANKICTVNQNWPTAADVIGGGQGNLICGDYTANNGILSGRGNSISGANICRSFIGAGQSNTISSNFSSITGGCSNTASGLYSSVVGGGLNIASGEYSVAGGVSSCATACGATAFGVTSIATGKGNFAAGTSARAQGSCESFAFGDQVLTSARRSFIFGSESSFGSGAVCSVSMGRRHFSNTAATFSTAGTDTCAVNQGQVTFGSNLSGDAFTPKSAGDLQHSIVVSGIDQDLLSGGATNLQNPITLQGTNKMMNVFIQWVATITTISGTADGVNVGDTITSTSSISVKKIGGVASLFGSDIALATQSDTSMSSTSMSHSIDGSNRIISTIVAPTFTGGGTITLRVAMTYHMTEVGF